MRLFLILALVLTIPHRASAQGTQGPKDTTKAVVARKRPWYDTTKAKADTAWVASTKGHTYYLDGCRGATLLTPKNIVRFKTEAQAKAAGFTRSKQWGC